MAKTGITFEQLAKELETGESNLRTILTKNKKTKAVPDTRFQVKGSRADLFPPAMVVALKAARESGQLGSTRNTRTKSQLKQSRSKLKASTNPFADAMKDLDKHHELKRALKTFIKSVQHLLD